MSTVWSSLFISAKKGLLKKKDAFATENFNPEIPNPENLDLQIPNPQNIDPQIPNPEIPEMPIEEPIPENSKEPLKNDQSEIIVIFAQIGQNFHHFVVLNVRNFAVKIMLNISVMIAPSKISKMCSSRSCSRASLFTLFMYASSGARGLT